jgi:hypothetical protein
MFHANLGDQRAVSQTIKVLDTAPYAPMFPDKCAQGVNSSHQLSSPLLIIFPPLDYILDVDQRRIRKIML